MSKSFNFLFIGIVIFLFFIAANTSAIQLDEDDFDATVIATMKDGSPFILIDLYPEIEIMISLTSDIEKKEYLLKRALLSVQESLEDDDEFSEHDVFVVRVILLKEVDEYNRPKWGTAPEVAILKIDKTLIKQLDLDKLNHLGLRDITPLVSIETFNLHEIKK